MLMSKSVKTYTKVAVKWLLVLGIINGMMPFVLSAFNRDSVSELGIAWVTEIVAVILGYLCKAYFETKQQKKQELEDFIYGKGEQENGSDEYDGEHDGNTASDISGECSDDIDNAGN